MDLQFDNYHSSFKRSQEVKSVFEFELPQDQEQHYNALKGEKYRQLLTELSEVLEKSIKDSQIAGTNEHEYLTPVLNFIGEKAVEYDVKVFRK